MEFGRLVIDLCRVDLKFNRIQHERVVAMFDDLNIDYYVSGKCCRRQIRRDRDPVTVRNSKAGEAVGVIPVGRHVPDGTEWLLVTADGAASVQ